jgi:hypothetical protein
LEEAGNHQANIIVEQIVSVIGKHSKVFDSVVANPTHVHIGLNCFLYNVANSL